MLAHRVMMGAAKGKAPDELSTTVFRWYKASQITGLSDGDPVSQWDDESANADHAVQATGANQPIYKTGILNGHPVVRFDGSNDYLTLSNILDATSSVGHFFAVAIHNGTGIANILSNRVDGSNSGGWLLGYQDQATPRYGHNGVGTVTYSATDQFNIIEAQRNGTTSSVIGVNGSLGSSSALNYTVAGSSATKLGVLDTNGTRALNGDIAEIVIYDSLLSSADRLALIQHFKAKYGIS